MTVTKLRYLWLDANGHIRNKLKIVDGDLQANKEVSLLSHAEQWSYDGSSTGQAVTGDSDLFINPVRAYSSTSYNHDEVLILCSVTDFDDNPIESEKRYQLVDLAKTYKDSGWLFGRKSVV